MPEVAINTPIGWGVNVNTHPAAGVGKGCCGSTMTVILKLIKLPKVLP